MIHFELIFIHDAKIEIEFIFFPRGYAIVPEPFCKLLSFLHYITFAVMWKSIGHVCVCVSISRLFGLLLYLFVWTPICYSLDYSSFQYKSGNISLLTLFFFYKVVLSILSPLAFMILMIQIYCPYTIYWISTLPPLMSSPILSNLSLHMWDLFGIYYIVPQASLSSSAPIFSLSYHNFIIGFVFK